MTVRLTRIAVYFEFRITGTFAVLRRGRSVTSPPPKAGQHGPPDFIAGKLVYIELRPPLTLRRVVGCIQRTGTLQLDAECERFKGLAPQKSLQPRRSLGFRSPTIIGAQRCCKRFIAFRVLLINSNVLS
jgi:hypothetical protein